MFELSEDHDKVFFCSSEETFKKLKGKIFAGFFYILFDKVNC